VAKTIEQRHALVKVALRRWRGLRNQAVMATQPVQERKLRGGRLKARTEAEHYQSKATPLAQERRFHVLSLVCALEQQSAVAAASLQEGVPLGVVG
jgi:hypothetical protein